MEFTTVNEKLHGMNYMRLTPKVLVTTTDALGHCSTG